MKNITTKSNEPQLTPIEIELGIDSDGMTTVSKLYDFLGMNRKNYARWYKTNIIDNQFAEENVDYFPFLINEEWGGQVSNDSRITAQFAKKLSMMQKNERGEQAREYFTTVERKAVDMVMRLKELQNNPIMMLELHYEAIKQVDSKVDIVRTELEQFKQEIPIFGEECTAINLEVKEKVHECLGGMESNAYQDKKLHRRLYRDIYSQTNRSFGVKTYKMLRRNQLDEYIKVIKDYIPPVGIKSDIDACNAQQTLNI